MFLATTALDEFWDKSQEILFLGSWCLRADRPARPDRLKPRILPSPWDDPARYAAAARYLEECYERMLSRLADHLNAAHGTGWSRRYWRILLGPWLFHFLHIFYDRYVHLQEALRMDPKLQTFVLNPQGFRTPRDTGQFVHWACEDPYNLQIFSQLLQGMGLSFPARSFQGGWPGEAGTTPKEGWPGRLKRAARSGLGLVESGFQKALGRRPRIALCDLYMPTGRVWAVAWRSGLTALPLRMKNHAETTRSPALFDPRRNSLASIPSKGEFEAILVRDLPTHFPTQYLEGYAGKREEILRRHSRNPEVVVSAVGWYFNEPFKFLAAEAAEKGSRLVAAQHGGGYGMYRHSPFERHESQVSDSFLVWGWADTRTNGLRNAPAPRLSRPASLRRAGGASQKGSVLFVATENPRYLCRFYSTPQGTQFEEYLAWQERFLEAVPPRLRSALCFRPHAHDWHPVRDRLSRKFPGIQWDDGAALPRSLRHRRLAVVDHLGTALLEVLAADLPTLLFWDTHRWETRPEAEPYFQDLRRAGILNDSPESAAERLERIFAEPDGWWKEPAVRGARDRFVERYARGEPRWAKAWSRLLMEEMARGAARPGGGVR